MYQHKKQKVIGPRGVGRKEKDASGGHWQQEPGKAKRKKRRHMPSTGSATGKGSDQSGREPLAPT